MDDLGVARSATRVAWWLAYAVACACALTGCGGGNVDPGLAATAAPRHGGTVSLTMSKEPPIVNPWLAQGAMEATSIIVDGLNDPLIGLDASGRWTPIIAERVPTIANGDVVLDGPHGMTVTVRMRPEAAWSDGMPLECDDVEFTWRTMMDERYHISNRLGWEDVDRVECPDTHTAVFVFGDPYALYSSRILFVGPLPRHELEGKDFNAYWNDRITVSSGPYVWGSWQRGVRIELERNERWWRSGPDDLPYADRVVFRFVKDANTLKMQLRMGEADIAWIPADTNLEQELDRMDGVEHASIPGALVEQLLLNAERAPTNDRNVRLALQHAIDREMIARVVLRDQVPVLDSSMVPTTDVYESSPFARYRADPAKVAQHLEAAGYARSGDGPWTKDGKPLELEWVAASGTYPFRTRVAQLVQQQLADQGILVDIQFITSEVLYSEVAPKGRFHIGEWSEATGLEPAPALLFACSEIPVEPHFAGKNRFRYCDEDLDVLMRAADREVDPVARGHMVREIDQRIADAAIDVPLFQAPSTVAWTSRVRGVVPNPPGYHTWNVEQWWVVDA